jgi:hypothetical protein
MTTELSEEAVNLNRCAYLQRLTNILFRKMSDAEIERAKSHFVLGTPEMEVYRMWRESGFPLKNSK